MKKEQARKKFIEFDNAMSDGETFFGLYNKEDDKETTTMVIVPNTTEGEAQIASLLALRLHNALKGMGDESDKTLLSIISFAIKKVNDWCEEDDEQEEIEECADCKYMRKCNEENAIKYRKMHNIPKPKKKSNKK